VAGSARTPYTLKNVAGVYSCSCPAWRNQSLPIDRRTCKHLRQYRGEAAEQARLGASLGAPVMKPSSSSVAPPLLLAHSWDNDQDLTGWFMSEKLDGVRAYWDGQEFLSRQGNRFYAPDWFVKGLPNFPLDGELWIGRQAFQQTVSIVRRQDAGRLWEQVLYAVFDAPAAGGTFEERLQVIRDANLELNAPQARILYQARCEGTDNLRAELARVLALGAEGLMLRQPGSLYEAGRSHTLLKVKQFQDAEAVVVGHVPGTGRHRGRLGSLEVELPNGVRFCVGSGLTDAMRNSPPQVGCVITFRYQELSSGGVPRFPTFVRIRPDADVTSAGPKARSGQANLSLYVSS